MAGFFDVVGAAVASGLCSENDYHAIMGTWSISTCLSSSIIAGDDSLQIPMGELRCLARNVSVHDGSPASTPDFAYNDQVLQRLSPEQNSLFFYPYLYASNIGDSTPATLSIGLHNHHRYDDILYAVYESILLAHMGAFAKIKDSSA